MIRIGDLPLGSIVGAEDFLVVHQGDYDKLVIHANPLVKYSTPAGVCRISQKVVRRISSTSYTVSLDDLLVPSILLFTSGSPTTVNLNSSANHFLLGSRIQLMRYGAGTLTVASSDGATLLTASSLTAKAQYSVISAEYYAVNTWNVYGDLT